MLDSLFVQSQVCMNYSRPEPAIAQRGQTHVFQFTCAIPLEASTLQLICISHTASRQASPDRPFVVLGGLKLRSGLAGRGRLTPEQ